VYVGVGRFTVLSKCGDRGNLKVRIDRKDQTRMGRGTNKVSVKEKRYLTGGCASMDLILIYNATSSKNNF
jgi:hypothetical protein